MTAALVGIDLGGTTTRVVVASNSSRTVSTSPTRAGGPDMLVEHIVHSVSAAAARADIGMGDIGGVGIGLPGTVDETTGSIRSAMNLGLGPEAVPLTDLVSDRLAVPVRVENDVKTGALGLTGMLPDRAGGILTYVSVGTGVSSAAVINGKLLRGVGGSAGEIGQMQLDPAGPSIDGALPGSLESFASGKVINAKDADLATALGYLARGVHALWLTLDPDLMILGGGVTHIAGFESRFTSSLESMRAISTVTASIIDLSRLRVLPSDALPGLDGALNLAQQVSGRATVPATTGGEPV